MKLFISASLVVVAAAITAAAQSGPALSALTVPAAALPEGCALIPPAPSPLPVVRGDVVFLNGSPKSPFKSNPWQGTDTKSVKLVRGAFGHPPRALPDLPPMSARQLAEADEKFVENVLEAYHADYIATDGSLVNVNALTFSDATFVPSETLGSMIGATRGIRTRLVRDATVALVNAQKTNPCARAIDAHVRARLQ